MEIKGTAVKSIKGFVQSQFSDRYTEWLDSLSPESRKIIESPIYATTWYPVKEAGIDPTHAICKMFYAGDLKKGAWEAGRFNAKEALTGVYKVFVKVASPQFIINRASRIIAAFYRPSSIEVKEKGSDFVVLKIGKLPMNDAVIENRIAGWIQQALEISGCDEVDVQITKSLSQGDDHTLIVNKWK